ncbi:MAG: hypothetical protein ABI912_11245 [Actinomycetota bacterium]
MARSSNREPTPRNRKTGVDRGGIPLVTGPIGAGAPVLPAASAEIPVAEPIDPQQPLGLTPFPDPEGTVPQLPIDPLNIRHWQLEHPEIAERYSFCSVSLPQGCYALTVRPNNELAEYRGTLRVDTEDGPLTASGDLYRYSRFFGELTTGELATTATIARTNFAGLAGIAGLAHQAHSRYRRSTIPIYPINRYHSYLKVTSVRLWSFVPRGSTCTAAITAEQYLYTQPPAGSFDGTFSPAPGFRTVTFSLHQTAAPKGLGGPRLEGTLYVGGVDSGTVEMHWVSKYFRKCTIEIDTLTGAVSPQAVPAHAGSRAAAAGLANEDFRSVFASAGWDARIEYDQTAVPVPAGVNANTCWSSADLHALMLNIRKATTNLDTEWRLHCLVVPAAMGCGRGVMYDTIQVPREGVASFCNDGYPTSQSANFGTAANQQQRNTPRAFMRSCSHEMIHGFNQIHQEQEGGGDNSIMTTTPSVADVLGGPATGEAGVFPDDIRLEVNDHVRHHLIHMPDIAVRPGGMTFGSGHGGGFVPERDRYHFPIDELMLTVEVLQQDVAIGEPVRIRYQLTNTGTDSIPVPGDISMEAAYTRITVIDPKGRSKEMPSYVIQPDTDGTPTLAPGESLSAETRVFWSTQGFAFTGPGTHVIDVKVLWTADGVPCIVRGQASVAVSAPISEADDQAANILLHPQVGQYVALGGGATHLTEAVSRLDSLTGTAAGDSNGRKGRVKALRGFEGLLPPSQIELDQPRRERVASTPKPRAATKAATPAGRRR